MLSPSLPANEVFRECTWLRLPADIIISRASWEQATASEDAAADEKWLSVRFGATCRYKAWQSADGPEHTATLNDVEVLGLACIYACLTSSRSMRNELSSALLSQQTSLPPYINIRWIRDACRHETQKELDCGDFFIFQHRLVHLRVEWHRPLVDEMFPAWSGSNAFLHPPPLQRPESRV